MATQNQNVLQALTQALTANIEMGQKLVAAIGAVTGGEVIDITPAVVKVLPAPQMAAPQLALPPAPAAKKEKKVAAPPLPPAPAPQMAAPQLALPPAPAKKEKKVAAPPLPPAPAPQMAAPSAEKSGRGRKAADHYFPALQQAVDSGDFQNTLLAAYQALPKISGPAIWGKFVDTFGGEKKAQLQQWGAWFAQQPRPE